MIKEIVNTNGFFSISDTGEVFSNRFGKIKKLKPYISKKGYPEISLFINGKLKHFLIHRLVAIHFIPNHENKPQTEEIHMYLT